MTTKLLWGDCTKVLGSQVSSNTLWDGFIIQKCVLAMFHTFFGEWKMAVAQEIIFVVTDLACKVCTIGLSHAACNSQACIEAWPFAIQITVKPISELYILGDCCKMHYHLYSPCSGHI